MQQLRTIQPQRRLWLTTIAAALVVMASIGQAQSGRDISKVNGGVRVEAGETVGKVSTVNGGVRIGANAVTGAVETVNGGIRLEDGARSASVDSVNGGVRLADGAQVNGTVNSVNGSITLAPGAGIDGDLKNVNGTITLDQARVGGQLSTTNGPILIGSGSVVEGGLLVRKPRGWSSDNRPPRIVIGPNAQVRGTLEFEREVLLYVHDSAHVGNIVGATPVRFSGAEPPKS